MLLERADAAALLVMTRDELADEAEETSWTPTTTSRTPSVRSGRCPIASPVALSTVR